MFLAPPDALRRRVYVNADLRLEDIRAVGFDMDYTLAVYNFETLEVAAFGFAVEALLDEGYPDILRDIGYRPAHAIRGLVIDKRLGNVVKMDRYNHVSSAWHGYRELDREAKRAAYANRKIPLASRRYSSVDTLYALPEVDLFSQVVQLRDERPEAFDGRGYRVLWEDVRGAVDACHRDGRLKGEVVQDPERYIEVDPELPVALARLRDQGKKLFLLTNSGFAYSDEVLRFLLDGKVEGYPRWWDYFDDVVVSAGKPAFFTRAPPAEVIDALPLQGGGERLVHEGGHHRELHRRLGCSGDEILFVGDHIYGDVIRAKRRSFWRTVMILPELEAELRGAEASAEDLEIYWRLLRRIEVLDCELMTLEDDPGADPTLLGERRARAHELRDQLLELEVRIDRAYHPMWGSLLKDGAEVSRFGDQVISFSDLYTSRVANLARYPRGKYFHSTWEVLPHLQAREIEER